MLGEEKRQDIWRSREEADYGGRAIDKSVAVALVSQSIHSRCLHNCDPGCEKWRGNFSLFLYPQVRYHRDFQPPNTCTHDT